MHPRTLMSVILLFIANAVLGADGQSTTEDPDISNSLFIGAQGPLNKDSTFSTFLPDLNVAPDTVTPEKQNSERIDFLNSGISIGTGDSISLVGSNLCVGNLGKRQESGFTAAEAGQACHVLPDTGSDSGNPNSIQKIPQLPTADQIQRGAGEFFRKTKERLPFFFGPQLPPKRDCKGKETLLCCEYEIPVLGDMDLPLGQDDDDEDPLLLTVTGCEDWPSWKCREFDWYCCPYISYRTSKGNPVSGEECIAVKKPKPITPIT